MLKCLWREVGAEGFGTLKPRPWITGPWELCSHGNLRPTVLGSLSTQSLSRPAVPPSFLPVVASFLHTDATVSVIKVSKEKQIHTFPQTLLYYYFTGSGIRQFSICTSFLYSHRIVLILSNPYSQTWLIVHMDCTGITALHTVPYRQVTALQKLSSCISFLLKRLSYSVPGCKVCHLSQFIEHHRER